MQKVVHLIPYDGIGGVEAAARTMIGIQHPTIDFQLRYLFPEVQSRTGRSKTFNMLKIWNVANALAAESPEVLIVSLWRSAIAGILVRLFNPRVKLVVFLHNSVDAHLIDFLVTRLAIFICHEVWTDSEATICTRLLSQPKRRVRTISFLAHRIEPDHGVKLVTPSFAFWGRLSAQKNLTRAVALFSEIRKYWPQATYLIIGPDGDNTQKLKKLVREMGLSDSIILTGPMDFTEIRAKVRDVCFYLQTSNYEGMAMSVVEAMQMGLVPVVTPVGEITSYCRDGDTAVVVINDMQAVCSMIELLNDASKYNALRQQAIRKWQGKPLYKHSVIASCEELISSYQKY